MCWDEIGADLIVSWDRQHHRYRVETSSSDPRQSIIGRWRWDFETAEDLFSDCVGTERASKSSCRPLSSRGSLEEVDWDLAELGRPSRMLRMLEALNFFQSWDFSFWHEQRWDCAIGWESGSRKGSRGVYFLVLRESATILESEMAEVSDCSDAPQRRVYSALCFLWFRHERVDARYLVPSWRGQRFLWKK